MPVYPVSLRLENQLCIVVGSGDVAMRKVKALQAAGAKIKIISPNTVAVEGAEVINRKFEEGDLTEAVLAIAATDDREVNKMVYEEATKLNIPVNVVDDPELCTFFVPSVVNRGELQITISTAGCCPALSKKVRKEIEGYYGPEYGQYLELIKAARKDVIENYPPEKRAAKLNEILNDNQIMNLVRANRIEEAMERVKNWISP